MPAARVRPALVAALALSLLAAPAVAADSPQVPELRYDLRLDVPITVVGALAIPGSQLLFAPEACRWCIGPEGPNRLDAAARRALRWEQTGRAAGLSDLTAFALVPLASFGLLAAGAADRDALPKTPIDLLVSAQATVITLDVTQLVKLTVARERPFVGGLTPAERAEEGDLYTSFFSGHTSFSFAVAVSSGTVASLRHYRTAPWIWATGLPLAGLAGYLRIAADKHFLTDVLVGAVVGSALGFALPYVFHRPLDG